MATPGPKPLELHAHAMDNLQYIRRTLERAGEFTAVPGLGGVLMGSTALVAAWIAGPRTASPRWLAVWLAAAVVALSIGIMAAALKSRRARQSLLSGPGRKFVAGFAPAMAAGALLTFVLASGPAAHLLPGIWLLLYAPRWCRPVRLPCASCRPWAPVLWPPARRRCCCPAFPPTSGWPPALADYTLSLVPSSR